MKMFQGIITIIFWIYLIGIMIFAPIQNWRYANEHGFTQWFFLGEIAATAKAFAWPYLLFSSSTKKLTNHNTDRSEWDKIEIEDFRHFIKSRDFDVAASNIATTFGSVQDLTSTSFTNYSDLKRNALVEAAMVKDTTLEKMYPGLATKYRNMFIYSIQMQLRGLNERDLDIFRKGAKLHNEWAEWFDTIKENTITPRKQDLR